MIGGLGFQAPIIAVVEIKKLSLLLVRYKVRLDGQSSQKIPDIFFSVIPAMSLEPDPAPAPSPSISSYASTTTRDWFFPSPGFIHSPVKPQKYPRRFTASSRISRPYPPDPRPPRISTFREVPASNPTPENELNYAGIRRRVDLARRREIWSKPNENGAAYGRKSEVTGVSATKPDSSRVSAEKESASKKFIGSSCRGLKIWWTTTIFVAVVPSLPPPRSLSSMVSSMADNCVCVYM